MFAVEVYYLESVNVNARVNSPEFNSRTDGWKVRYAYLRKWLLSSHWERWLYEHKTGAALTYMMGRLTQVIWVRSDTVGTGATYVSDQWEKDNLHRWSSLANGRKIQPTQVVDSLCWSVGGRHNLHKWSWLGLALEKVVFGRLVIRTLKAKGSSLEP